MRSWSFVRHFLEMVAAMVVGMLVLGPFWSPARVDLAAGWMATTMAVAMAVWMWHRGHSNAAIGEMTAAMYLPFLILLPTWWAGLIPGEAVILGGHVLMLPAMALAMWHRAGEHPHGPRTGLLSRWPSVLALLFTVDLIVRPQPIPPWTPLVLPLAYLVIGAVRGTLRPTLKRQLAGLAAYLVLFGAALVTEPAVSIGLVGAGWLVHAGWDVWHHRTNAVVPRAWAEWCGVLDVIVGVTVLSYAITL